MGLKGSYDSKFGLIRQPEKAVRCAKQKHFQAALTRAHAA